MQAPLVSIGLPVFNGEAFLEECLNSILAQGFEDFELLISDNASTDNTAQICQQFMEDDSRIRYVRQAANMGAAKNYNIVFEMAKGKYFKWAAHDDLMMPTYLQECVGVLEEDTEHAVVLAYPKTVHFDERSGDSVQYNVELPWGSELPSKRLQHCLVDGPDTILTKCYPVFGLMRREVLAETRLIQAFNSSDKVLLVEMALRGDFQQVPDYLFHRRLHDNTSLNASKSQEEVAQWFDPNQGERYPMPFYKLVFGFLRAIREAPLAATTKWRCNMTIAHWCMMNQHWRNLLSEPRKRLLQDLGIRARVPTTQPNEFFH